MRRSTAILGVLLGVSVLANAMMAVRLSRTAAPEPATSRTVAGADPARRPQDLAELRETVEREKKKNEELRGKIERLETDKKVLAQDAPGSKVDKLAVFKAKLRKMIKMAKDPNGRANLDPEATVEMTEAWMDFYRLAVTRSKDPKTYVEYLQAAYEVALEGEGTALTEAQTATLSKLFQDMAQGYTQIPPTPAGERLLKEIELEGATMTKLNDLLTEAQKTSLQQGGMTGMFASTNLMTSYIAKDGAVDQIAQAWTQAYQLDEAQQTQAKAAAQAFLDGLARLDEQTKTNALTLVQGTGSPEAYDYRIRAVKEQLAALKMLEASMSPAQQDRLRTQTIREFFLYDAQAFTQKKTDK